MQACPFCTKAKDLLNELGQSFEEIDVGSAEGRAALERVGAQGVPVLFNGDQHVIGFQPEQIRALLANR